MSKCATCKNSSTCPNTGVEWCPSNEPLDPVVSVICLTYNQKDFVRQAVDSFLMQKTNFPIEILIHDDASIDGTADIVREYAAQHPEKIRLIVRPENTYRNGEIYPYMTLYRIARGRYLAECDGDDYWTDPEKLQKQVDYLETHPNDVICYHENVIDRKGRIEKAKPGAFRDYTADHLRAYDPFYAWPIHVSSRMFRNTYTTERDAEMNRMIGDWPMIVYLSQFGGAKFLADIKPSVYRRHGKNSWASQPRADERRRVKTVTENINAYLAEKKRETIMAKRSKKKETTKASKPYCIVAPPWSELCGGGVVMHRLAHELFLRGCDVSMNTDKQNPAWPALPVATEIRGGIAVYPEQVYGNDLQGETVVRFILHRPGNFGGPKTYPVTDLLFAYSEYWNREAKLNLPPERILFIPNLNPDVFYNMRLKRNGCLMYRGKGKQKGNPYADCHPRVGAEFSIAGPTGQARLREAFNRCQRLFCYDNATAMVNIALLCGCPVTLLPDDTIGACDYYVPSLGDGMKYDDIAAAALDAHKRELDRMDAQLQKFIKITQRGK